jgi:hypothetical protein
MKEATEATQKSPESGEKLLEVETMLPVQFFSRTASNSSDYPEKRLMLAVLEEAVATFQRYVDANTRHGQRLFSEAEEWLNSGSTEWAFTAENICNALEIEAEYLRRGLQEWKERRQNSTGAKVYRFPFRRMNGRRNAIRLRSSGARKSA